MNSLMLILSRKRYFAPVWVFASLNVILGTWVLYIPRIKEKLSLSDGDLGAALFCYALGVLLAILFTSRLVKWLGVGKVTIIGIILFASLFLGPLIATNYLLFCATLLCTGVASGMTDIAMNALVSDIETADDVPFMSAAHGFFSLGGVLGAGVGSLFIAQVTIPVYHMLIASFFVIVTNVLLAKNYIHIQSAVVEEKKGMKIGVLKPLIGLAIIGLIVMGSEGAIEQWSKLYLQDIVGVSIEWMAGLGFVIFSAAMTTGRFFGDAVSKRLGSLKIIIVGCFIAILGYGIIFLEVGVLPYIGFGCIGIGFSVVIPELFRLAGKVDGVSSSEGISFVAGVGFLGFMAAPASMGFLAELSSLRLSFFALAVGCCVAFLVGLLLWRKRMTGH